MPTAPIDPRHPVRPSELARPIPPAPGGARPIFFTLLNHTNHALRLVAEHHFGDGFDEAPAAVLPPHSMDVFGSWPGGPSLGRGSVGQLTYDWPGCSMILSWSNPSWGRDWCTIELKELGALRARALAIPGPDGTEMRFEIHENAWEIPRGPGTARLALVLD